MDYSQSKKSSIRGKADNAIVYEPLDRGHQSEINQLKKSIKIPASRRVFTFIGSAGKPSTNPPPSAKARTPSKPVTPRTHTPRSHHRSRSRSTLATKLLSSIQKSTTVKKDRSRSTSLAKRDRARSTSLAKKDRSRSGSLIESRREDNLKRTPSTVRNQPMAKSPTPVPVEITAPQKQSISPAILIDEEPKIKTEETKEELVSPAVVVPSITSSDEQDEGSPSSESSSPSVIGYRKLVYDENQDKWIEYWKLEEDVKRAKRKEKAQKFEEKLRARKQKPQVHPIKGKVTAKMQIMFPTAIVKQDRRHGQYYQNIQMTDPLRVELYKRRAPVVPTYFQEHIVKFGKLPFRNNPRPHPIV